MLKYCRTNRALSWMLRGVEAGYQHAQSTLFGNAESAATPHRGVIRARQDRQESNFNLPSQGAWHLTLIQTWGKLGSYYPSTLYMAQIAYISYALL